MRTSMKIVHINFQIFFVLRKKFNQITFLHVYHHGGMIFAVYIFCKFLTGIHQLFSFVINMTANLLYFDYTGSHGTLLGILNSFVHVVMYGYYFLTSFKPELKNSLWWKKHITQIQLVCTAVICVIKIFLLNIY